ncbi:MAG: sugar-binding transcriptional regulator [Lachnospiraceae bacterium]|nr:sugar-binding transcriptional regulator [Lachnospiraceae bacterium]
MDNRKLDVKIAHFYYTLGLTQDEIAKRLSLTRQKVNQIMNSLVEKGVVSIVVNGELERSMSLEQRLEEKFHLKQAVVVESHENDTEKHIFQAVTEAAARHFERIVQNKSIVGVSWGETLTATVGHMQYRKRGECRVIQLVGTQNMWEGAVTADEIVRNLANKLDCPSFMMYAPNVVVHAETKKCLMEEEVLKKSFEWIRKCDIALIGIGELGEKCTIWQKDVFPREEILKLQNEGFCGDICLNFLRIDGDGESCKLRKRIIGVSLEDLRTIPNVMAVATGREKVEAIVGALKSGCINTLIIDDDTAQRVCDFTE